MTLLVSASAALLSLTIAWAVGVPGLLYLICWAAVCAPGVPLGMRAFGRGGAGLVAGCGFGYAATTLTWWAVIAAGVPSRGSFALAWLAAAALLLVAWWLWRTSAVFRTVSQAGPETPWTARDTASLLAVLILVPVLMGMPYHNLGSTDREGRRYYRAYFTADFVWHAALTAELARFETPPRNPYLADRPLTYYWTYFIVPAALSEAGPGPVRDVEVALKANAIATAVLLLGSLHAFVATATRRRAAAAVGIILVVVASSAEGLAAIYDLWSRGRPLAALKDMNIDAVTAWWYDGLRIDGVHRTMFYTPQHGLSCAFGLLALAVAARRGAAASVRDITLAGLLLGGATMFNPFLGAAFCAIYGLAVLADAAVRHRSATSVFRHSIAAVPPVLAIAWGVANGMSEGAGEALTFGWTGHARRAPVATLLLSLGPVLVPALYGFRRDARLPGQPARTAAAGLLVGLGLFYFVMLSDQFWVGFRAGQILLAMTALPLARVFDWLLDSGRRTWAAALVAVILVVGLPTTAIDTYNASDISNTKMGPGFPWTVTLSAREQEALAWVRNATPRTARVQVEPIVRGRAEWSLIPSFADRRMSAGLPISLLPSPEYQRQSARVREIFLAPSVEEAHAIARELHIDYLWIGRADRSAYPQGVARLASDPTLFIPVFTNSEVSVYAIR
jgi:hypothetical protein